MMRYLVLFLPLFLFSANLTTLLQKYKASSDLSRLTKKESAGIVHVFTRQELESMQAYTLKDVLKLVSLLHYTITPNNLYIFSLASLSYLPTNILRIYIDDHDVTSATFTSALPIWSDMPIELVDHIEIYKASASIEFGNEPASIIIRIYTKSAERDSGNKIRTVFDNRGSKGVDFYRADTTEKGSYFVYGHGDVLRYKKEQRAGYEINRDSDDTFLFGKFIYQNHKIEAAHYHTHRHPFLGHGKALIPTGGGMKGVHDYLHYQYFKNGTVAEFSVDNLTYDRSYKDLQGVYYNDNGVPKFAKEEWFTHYHDTIVYLGAHNDFIWNNFEATVGAFVKNKKSSQEGKFDALRSRTSLTKQMYSLYGDLRQYFQNHQTMLFLSLKGDLYRYSSTVPQRKKMTIRTGLVHNLSPTQLKVSFTQSYLPIEMYRIYPGTKTPYITNPHLKPVSYNILHLESSTTYKNWHFSIRYGYRNAKNFIRYSPTKGFYNIKERFHLHTLEGECRYYYDPLNFVALNVYGAHNTSHLHYSPDFGINLQIFNQWGKWNIYNELLYKDGYEQKTKGKHVRHSLDYSLALKYHFTPDFSLGLKLQNITAEGFRQAISRVDQPFEVYERRAIVNLEYTF